MRLIKFTLSFFMFFILFSASSSAQDSTISLSKFQVFSTQSGKLFKTFQQSIGYLNTMTVDLLETRDLQSGETRKAIRLSSDQAVETRFTERNALYIDMEDLPALIMALDTFAKEISSGHNDERQKYHFITSNDIRFSLSYQDGLFSAWHFEINQQYRYLQNTRPGYGFYLGKRNLEDLLSILKRIPN